MKKILGYMHTKDIYLLNKGGIVMTSL
jgi:hypothetical protein